MSKPEIFLDVAKIKEEVKLFKGDLSTLQTTAKDNIPNIINELFQNVSNGKSLIGGAITGIDNTITIPTDATFQQLASAIEQISTGIKFATGTISGATNPVITGLSFRPKLVIIQTINTWNTYSYTIMTDGQHVYSGGIYYPYVRVYHVGATRSSTTSTGNYIRFDGFNTTEIDVNGIYKWWAYESI